VAEISVSAFAADFARMGRDLGLVRRSGADALHVDVMDGHFVPAMGLGPAWLRSLGKRARLPALDIHLMTGDPWMFAPQFFDFRPRSIVFHLEADPALESAEGHLRFIASRGIACGLAISPGTPMAALEPFVDLVDEILIMGSQPGREGAFFENAALDRIGEARKMVEGHDREIEIAIDGGLDETLAEACILRGATKVVIGRAFFRSRRKRALVRKVHGLLSPESSGPFRASFSARGRG
jgi:ribulose-phosphate 3-epimerase